MIEKVILELATTQLTDLEGEIIMYMKVKRVMDIVLSSLGIVILSPVFIVLIIAIKAESKGPVLFKQKRVGIHKKHFNILKFRTMRIDTPQGYSYSLIRESGTVYY